MSGLPLGTGNQLQIAQNVTGSLARRRSINDYYSPISVSQCGIWSRVLSEDEIQGIFNGFKTLYGYAEGLIIEGLALYYDPTLYSSLSGSTLMDISGNGRHGTLEGGASVENGYIHLDGSPQYVSTTYQPNLDNYMEYAFECWFWDDAVGITTNNNTALISNYGQDATTEYTGLHIFDDGKLNFAERNASSITKSIMSTSSVVTSSWNHIVATSSSTTMYLYVNGVLQGTATRPGGVITSNMNIVIGGHHYSSIEDRYQTCRIGSIRIYHGRSLSQSDVLKNYNVGRR